ncbi:MAG TPA: hypothetical protein VF824_10695 [Thermoanaerobaculia bacterium]|jgi:hypothetical protein
MAKFRLPALSRAHREFNRRLALVEDRVAKYVVPLYGTDERGQRYVIGSGVLVQVHDEGFLVTAAHVLDENRRAMTNIEVPGRGALVPIGGQALKSPLPASGRREDDWIDIGAVPLSPALRDEVGTHFRFLDVTQIDPSDAPGPRTRYTFVAYPSSQHDGPRGGVLTIEPLRLTSDALSPEKYPRGFQLETHVCIDFDAKKMVSRTARVQRPPDPHGVSGGAVFRIGTWDEIIAGTNEERLVVSPSRSASRSTACLARASRFR